MSNVDRASVFHLQPTVFHDAVFVAGSDSDLDRHQVAGGFFDRSDGSVVGVFADDAVAVAGVGDHVCRRNAEFFLNNAANLAEVVVFDVPDAADGHRVNGHDGRRCRTGFQNERFHIKWIIDRTGIEIGDVDLGNTRQQRFGHGGLRLHYQSKDDRRNGHSGGQASAD